MTWTRLKPSFALHDLMHYAVETTLGLRDSFYGLLAGGIDISAFNVPKAERTIEITKEAALTEFIVAAFQMETVNGRPHADLNDEIRKTCEDKGLMAPPPPAPPPAINDEAIATIRGMIAELVGRWHGLAPGERMELVFEETQETGASSRA